MSVRLFCLIYKLYIMNTNFDENLNVWVAKKREALELSHICSTLEFDKKTERNEAMFMKPGTIYGIIEPFYTIK